MEILFEDKSVIVCLKPAGILSQADADGSKSMITELSEHTGGTIYPLHRLDKEVGGVMVYAKTQKAAAALSGDIAQHRFNKEYLAVIHGRISPEEGTLCDLLFKDSRKNKSYVVKRMRKGVKQAELDYKCLESREFGGEEYTLVKVALKTGRTHQIRVQFASRGFPLAGDKKYGAHDVFKNIMLRSQSLSFFHPETKEKLTFSATNENFSDFFKKIKE